MIAIVYRLFFFLRLSPPVPDVGQNAKSAFVFSPKEALTSGLCVKAPFRGFGGRVTTPRCSALKKQTVIAFFDL